MPYGQGGMMGPQGGMPVAGTGPTTRNALMTWLLPFAVAFGGSIIGGVLGAVVSPGLYGLSSLFCLAASIWYLVLTVNMINEVKSVTRNPNFAWWPMLVPFFNIYWALILVPQEVTNAKQLLGVQQPARNVILYFFLFPFALASDINDMVR